MGDCRLLLLVVLRDGADLPGARHGAAGVADAIQDPGGLSTHLGRRGQDNEAIAAQSGHHGGRAPCGVADLHDHCRASSLQCRAALAFHACDALCVLPSGRRRLLLLSSPAAPCENGCSSTSTPSITLGQPPPRSARSTRTRSSSWWAICPSLLRDHCCA